MDITHIKEEKSIVPQLMSAILNQPGTSHSVEITEINENEPIDNASVEMQLLNKLISGELTYTDYARCMGEDLDLDEEEDDDEDEGEEVLGLPADTMDSDLESKINATTPAQRKRIRQRRSVLPTTLLGLMGEANLRWARGETEIAEKICFEIIRQVPTAPEPFQTLAQIYEADNPEKSLQFSLIAAHLSPHNSEEWMRFMNISLEKGDLKQATMCLTKAINADPKNINYHLKRLELYKNLNDTSRYQISGLRLLSVLKPDEHSDLIVNYSQSIAETFYKDGALQKAKEAMDHLFQKCPLSVTLEHVNRMIEVLLGCKLYEKILELLVEFCSFSIEAEKQTYKNSDDGGLEENIIILNYHIPDEIPVDIHAKFLICLIHMKLFHLVERIQNEVGQFNVEQHGDLLFDIAEAFMQENLHSQAFIILDKLVTTERFSMAAVWLRHAECLQACRKFAEAVESYKQVIELAPQLADVRMTLSTLLREQGRVNEAIIALDQEATAEELDPHVLIQRCKLLRQHMKFKEYIRDAFLLLARHCVDDKLVYELTHHLEIDLDVINFAAVSPMSDVFLSESSLKPEKGKTKDKDRKAELPLQQEWLIFKDILNIAYLSKQMNLMQRISQAGLSSKRFLKDYKKDLELMNAIACIYSKDHFNGYNILRFLVLNDLHNVNLWNLFNALLQDPEDNRSNKFLIRLLARVNLPPEIRILHANNCLVAGTYKYALSEYSAIFRLKESPMVAFLIAVTMFQMACQKNTAKKHSLVVQGHAFLTIYKKLRGEQCYHEVCYNFGRAFHQLGIFPMAIHYYKQVLEFDSPLIRQQSRNELDLKREAAFNLSLCYKNGGAHDLALMYLRKYIVV